MTPEEKAKELVEKFMPLCYVPWMGEKDEATQEDCAKDAALLCVDEIIVAVYAYDGSEPEVEYWEKVKDCITAL